MIEVESELSAKLAQLILLLDEVQSLAKQVKAQGGDVQRVFMARIPESERAEFALQWPFISMLLGV